MKRILGSLFVIVAIVGAGIAATGAYFTTTDTANNYHFYTSSASLSFNFCPGTNTDCSTTPANLTSYTFSTASLTGPGQSGVGCLVVENTGQYLLHLTSQLVVTSASPDGMQDAFQVESQLTNSNCADPSGYSEIFSWQSARNAAAAGAVTVQDLAPGQKIYILERNRWDSTGNQNALQNGDIYLNTSITGQTD
jgi:hypothetical protein